MLQLRVKTKLYDNLAHHVKQQHFKTPLNESFSMTDSSQTVRSSTTSHLARIHSEISIWNGCLSQRRNQERWLLSPSFQCHFLISLRFCLRFTFRICFTPPKFASPPASASPSASASSFEDITPITPSRPLWGIGWQDSEISWNCKDEKELSLRCPRIYMGLEQINTLRSGRVWQSTVVTSRMHAWTLALRHSKELWCPRKPTKPISLVLSSHMSWTGRHLSSPLVSQSHYYRYSEMTWGSGFAILGAVWTLIWFSNINRGIKNKSRLKSGRPYRNWRIHHSIKSTNTNFNSNTSHHHRPKCYWSTTGSTISQNFLRQPNSLEQDSVFTAQDHRGYVGCSYYVESWEIKAEYRQARAQTNKWERWAEIKSVSKNLKHYG